MWRQHCGLPLPSHHLLRTTCMQLLPLMEMYCKWELEEDCNNLRSLMLRFDSELELEAHELGRSLLFMVQDDDMGLNSLPQRVRPTSQPNPFDVVRERLAAVGSTIRDLHPQVHLFSNYFFSLCKLAKKFVVPLRMGIKLFRTYNVNEFENENNVKHIRFNCGWHSRCVTIPTYIWFHTHCHFHVYVVCYLESKF